MFFLVVVLDIFGLTHMFQVFNVMQFHNLKLAHSSLGTILLADILSLAVSGENNRSNTFKSKVLEDDIVVRVGV